MMYGGIMAAFFVAVMLTAVAVLVFRNKGPWGLGWMVFLILFLALWTVSLYIRAMGPVWYGVSWLPILFAGILLLLLLLAIPKRREAESEGVSERSGAGSIYWILIAVFVLAIIIGLMNPQPAM